MQEIVVAYKSIQQNAYLSHSHKKQMVWKLGPNDPFYALVLRNKLY